MSDILGLRTAVTNAALLVATTLSGCAQRSLSHDIDRTVCRAGVQNASAQRVAGMPWLRVDTRQLARLKSIGNTTDVEEARTELRSALLRSRQLADQCVRAEVDCLPLVDAERLWRVWFSRVPAPPNLRTAIWEQFARECGPKFDELWVKTDTADTVDELQKVAARITRHTRPSPKDRHGRGLILALVARSIQEDSSPIQMNNELVDIYSPSIQEAFKSDPTVPPDHEQPLLVRFAPVIIQQRLQAAPYDPKADEIGTVRLDSQDETPRIVIDTQVPSVYAYTTRTMLGGREHLQLVYTFWLPEHPPSDPSVNPGCACSDSRRFWNDPEAGRIDGATLRITLDSQDRPAIAETMLNCGCHHRCWPSRGIEHASAREYSIPEKGKKFSVERDVPRRLDLIVPAVVAVPDEEARPIVYCRAGDHGIGNLEYACQDPEGFAIVQRKAYMLRSYAELEHLPFRDRHASMFDSKGLVRGARRGEGRLLAITGMLSAGQPRQRGTQRIRWDVYDFDDPRLLEECLRLPSGL